MSEQPTYRSHDDSVMIIADTAHVRTGEYDGIADLNAFSATGAVGVLAQVRLDRRVVLLAATKERRAAEILELMDPQDALAIVTHLDPDLVQRLLAQLPGALAGLLTGAVAADHSILRFAAEHRSAVGDAVAGLERFDDGPPALFRREYANGFVYHGPSGAGFLDKAFQAEHAGAVPRHGFPIGLPTPVTSSTGKKGRLQKLVYADTLLFLTEVGDFEVHGSMVEAYRERGGPEGPLGFPIGNADIFRVQYFEGGALGLVGAGSVEVVGDILDVFREHRSQLVLPTSAPWPVTSAEDTEGEFQNFQGGTVFASDHGAFVVAGAVQDAYVERGGVSGEMGFPVAGAHTVDEMVEQQFEAGYIVTDGETGYVVPTVVAELPVELGMPTSQPLPLKAEPDFIQFFEDGVVTVVDGEAEYWLHPESDLVRGEDDGTDNADNADISDDNDNDNDNDDEDGDA